MSKYTEGKTLVRHGVEIKRTITRVVPASEGFPPHSWIEVHAGFHYIAGNDGPHFSVTCEVYRSQRQKKRGDFEAGGAAHEMIARIVPELAPVLRWHLSSMTTGPMHYVENARYWAELVRGVSPWQHHESSRTDPLAAFRSTVVFGAVETDGTDADAKITATLTGPELVRWLAARKPALMAAFRVDVDRVLPGVWEETERACWE